MLLYKAPRVLYEAWFVKHQVIWTLPVILPANEIPRLEVYIDIYAQRKENVFEFNQRR